MPVSPDPQGLVPVLIAVTGHRHLRETDRAVLSARLDEVLRALWRALPHSPLVLLSPLAEGADRLAAEVALELGVWSIALPQITK